MDVVGRPVMTDRLVAGLSTAPLLTRARSRSVTAENPDGRKGAGGTASSVLGVGRKGRPSIGLEAGGSITLMDAEGPGVIRHIWLTVADRTGAGDAVLRDLVLRMWWDEEADPSVEVPLGDFFCNGFAARCD